MSIFLNDDDPEEMQALKRRLDNLPDNVPVGRRDLEFYSHLVAEHARRKMLQEFESLIGYDLADSKQRQQFRHDMEFIKTVRAGSQAAGMRFFTGIVSALAIAFTIIAWEGFRVLINR